MSRERTGWLFVAVQVVLLVALVLVPTGTAWPMPGWLAGVAVALVLVGLVVAAVNFRETDAAIRSFLERMPVSLTLLRDADGAVSRSFGARILPTTVVVGRDGRAQFSLIGEVDWTGPSARDWLAPLLAARTR